MSDNNSTTDPVAGAIDFGQFANRTPLFKVSTTCPKCGGTRPARVRYCTQDHAARARDGPRQSAEHWDRTCVVCTYTWSEDMPPKPAPR